MNNVHLYELPMFRDHDKQFLIETEFHELPLIKSKIQYRNKLYTVEDIIFCIAQRDAHTSQNTNLVEIYLRAA